MRPWNEYRCFFNGEREAIEVWTQHRDHFKVAEEAAEQYDRENGNWEDGEGVEVEVTQSATGETLGYFRVEKSTSPVYTASKKKEATP